MATLDDIIARLKENCSEEVNLIDEYCYRYDGYCGNGLWNVPGYVYESGTIGADLKMHEVSELYDEIIEETINEYSNKKTLKRTK